MPALYTLVVLSGMANNDNNNYDYDDGHVAGPVAPKKGAVEDATNISYLTRL